MRFNIGKHFRGVILNPLFLLLLMPAFFHGELFATCGCTSPIVIDTNGEGFQFTSVTEGVRFDIKGDGNPIRLAWTEAGSRNAFLALDRDHNGRIDNGKELFGNFTEQPASNEPNGYLALAEFDKPENGGNGDGLIDQRDNVFSKLLLWIDENHDGISQPEELHSLREFGIYSLGLKYKATEIEDQYGNWLRLKGRVNPEGQPERDHVDRVMYDVFFVSIQNPPAPNKSSGARSGGVVPYLCCNTCTLARKLNPNPFRANPLLTQGIPQEPLLAASLEGSRQVLSVTNPNSSPMTAFVATVELPGGAAFRHIYFDAYSENYRRNRPLKQGETERISLPQTSGQPPNLILHAALFGDGTIWGDSRWANELLLRRRILLRRLYDAIDVLQVIETRKLPREQALSSLGASRQQRAALVAAESPDRQVLHDRIFQMAIANVGGGLRVNGKTPEIATAAHHLARHFDVWRAYLESAAHYPGSPTSPSALDQEEIGARVPTASLNPAAALPRCTGARGEASFVTSGPNNCGTKYFELVATLDGIKFDAGNSPSFGTCYGGVSDCQGVFHPLTRQIAGKNGPFFTGPVKISLKNYMYVEWQLDNWSDLLAPCADCDPDPNGVDEVQSDSQFLTTPYYILCQ